MMQAALLGDHAELAQLNAALARYILPISARTDGTHAISADGPDETLAAILNKIGETILPRQLAFGMGNRVLLVVSAANRQLLRILDSDPALSAEPSLMNCALVERGRLVACQLAALFRRMVAMGGPISVRSSRIPGGQSSSEMGIAVDLIAQNAVAQPLDSVTRIDRFFSASGESLIAFLQIRNAEIIVADGDDGTLSDLLDLTRMIWGDEEADGFDPAGPTQFVLLATATGDAAGLCTVMIRAGQTRYLMQHDSAFALSLAANWAAAGQPF